MAAGERCHDVHALAAGQERKAFEAERVEGIAHAKGGIAHPLEADGGIGVEIENQPIGLVDGVDL